MCVQNPKITYNKTLYLSKTVQLRTAWVDLIGVNYKGDIEIGFIFSFIYFLYSVFNIQSYVFHILYSDMING